MPWAFHFAECFSYVLGGDGKYCDATWWRVPANIVPALLDTAVKMEKQITSSQ